MQYIGHRRTYDELVDIFRKEIYEKEGKLPSDKTTKYFECLNLIKDLK